MTASPDASGTDPTPAELQQLRHLSLRAARRGARVRDVAIVEDGADRWPLTVIEMGSEAPDAPALGLFGGVHGLERIGSGVVMAFLDSVLHRLRWDDSLHQMLERLRLVFMPLVNPGGLQRGTRANPRGVDLMRNAPVVCPHGAAWMVGGQRLSPSLPWYQGPQDAPMEVESAALCEVVQQRLMGSPFSLALDCHSGFGMQDRLWFPMASTRRPMQHLDELLALVRTFEGAHPHHPYVFEPQSSQYLTHGDLWDHLCLSQAQQACGPSALATPVMLPLTLEMGSWLWVKKNPRQMFSRHGIFNPLKAHRHDRVLRRHLSLMDFLLRAVASHERWRPQAAQKPRLHQEALRRWYAESPGDTRGHDVP